MSQKAYTFSEAGKEGKLNYLLFVPKGYGKDRMKKWPVIFFLHGAGERGDDPEVLKKRGIPKIAEEQAVFPFLAVSPQCPERSRWGQHIRTLGALLNRIFDSLTADPDRLYLTGISMGGNGVWQLATRYPKRFAALAPICGYGLRSQGFPEKIRRLKDVPVWVFHGGRDYVVSMEESRILVNTLRACGGQVRFTIYPNCGHDSWTRTYKNPELYRWFLSHSLTGPR